MRSAQRLPPSHRIIEYDPKNVSSMVKVDQDLEELKDLEAKIKGWKPRTKEREISKTEASSSPPPRRDATRTHRSQKEKSHVKTTQRAPVQAQDRQEADSFREDGSAHEE